MGTLHVRNANPDEGLFFKTAYLESIFPMKKGEIFSVAKVRKAIEDYTKLYGNFGFIDFTAVPDTDVHDDTKTIDLTFAFDQQKQFFVRRIDFTGNTGTRDKVIRRELLLNEGDMFRNNLWELSLLRLNQLDYFEAVKPENAEIKRNVKQGTVDILLKLKEKGKQSISLTGGVSGFAGSYIGLTYQTNNFLGLGETLTLSAERRHPAAQRFLRLHRAVSVRPADQHGFHRLREPLQLQSGAAIFAGVGLSGAAQSQHRAELHSEQRRLHRLCQLSAEEARLHPPGLDVRIYRSRASPD